MQKTGKTSFFNNPFFIIGIILFITAISFYPVLKNDFVHWDDPSHLLNLPEVRELNLANLQQIFQRHVHGIYIPLTLVSFSLEHHFFQFNPFIYHLNNLLLHLGVVCFVFLIGRQLGLPLLASAFAALLFGIHPMHVESVAWVTERKDVLYAFFYLAAFWVYLRYLIRMRQGRASKHYLVWVCLLGFLSILAKPMAVSLPLILLLADWFRGRKMGLWVFVEKLPLGVLLGSVTLITYLQHHRIPVQEGLQGLLIWPWSFTFYLRQFLFPVVLVPVYRISCPVSLGNPEYSLSLLVFILIAGSLVFGRKHKWYIFAVLFYFLSIFFLLRFDIRMDTNIVADRWMYLPSLGFCYLIGLGLRQGIAFSGQARRLPRALVLSMIVLVFALVSYKTYKQSQVWRNTGTLWMHQLKWYPYEPIALSNMATFLRQLEGVQQAERWYKADKEKEDRKQDVSSDQQYETMRQTVQTVNSLLVRALKVQPASPDAPFNLGEFYMDIGEYQKALEAYRLTASLFPAYKDVLYKIAILHFRLKDYNKAYSSLDKYVILSQEKRWGQYAHFTNEARQFLRCRRYYFPEDFLGHKECLKRHEDFYNH